MDFTFNITAYDQEALAPQVSQALEKRTELISRAQCPQLWNKIDKLHANKAPEQTLQKRRIRYRIYGLFLLVMGIILLVPGLMDPKELLVPLIVGALATGIGLRALLGSRKNKTVKFNQAAIKLLASFQDHSTAQVVFTPTEMVLAGTEAIPYADFSYIIEGDDLYLITYNDQVTVLQKKDLVSGGVEDFRQFVASILSTVRFHTISK